MNFDYTLQNVRFEWDIWKASVNLRKHGISFEKASEVFFDPFVRVMDVEDHDGEFREAIVGLTTDWKLLYVVYTIRGEDIFRIISARRGTGYQRRLYENQ